MSLKACSTEVDCDCQRVRIPLISEVIQLPTGVLSTHIQKLKEDVSCWFLEAGFPLPPCMVIADGSPFLKPEIDSWMELMSEVAGQKAEGQWRNLTSGKIELYLLTMKQRNEFHIIETKRKVLISSFHDIAGLCDIHGHPFLSTIISEQRLLFFRAGLVFLAMSQGLERTLNSWRDTHAQVASTLLDEQLVLMKSKNRSYRIPKTPWNDDYIISHKDLDQMSLMKWLNSNLIDVFISKLNVKFSSPVCNRHVAFFDTNFAFHYILPGTKEHETLRNSDGALRSKPLRALQDRFNNGNVMLVFPLNMNNIHWFIGVISGASSAVELFDSIDGSLSAPAYQRAYANMIKLWKILAEACSTTVDWDWKLILPPKIPRQINNSDCGIFAIMYMIHLGYGPQINHELVPVLYHLPLSSQNMAGMRLLLLGEMEL